MSTLHRSISLSLCLLVGCATASPASVGPTLEQTSDRADAAVAVASACGDLPEAELSQPLFGGRLTVASARTVTERHGKQMSIRPAGAELVVPAEPGLTAPYLHRLASCQAARYAAAVAASETDPLAVEGARVAVREAGPSFVVRITADARSAAREIADRAARL